MSRRLAFRRGEDLAAAVTAVLEVQAAHGLVAVPTETFYGLAVPPGDATAVARLFAVKGRPPDKALPVMGGTLEQLETLVALPPDLRRRLAATWPAPLTVILPLRGAVAWPAATLAVRVPAHPLLRALLTEVGPLTTTSANRSGAPPLSLPDQVEAELGDALALLLDGGPTAGGRPTTIVDWSRTPPVLVRRGAFPLPPAWGVKSA